MIAFVTIGSTHFDPLVRSVLSPSVLHSLHSIGYSKLIVQCGDSKLDTEALLDAVPEDVNVEVWRYKPSLQADYQRADLVISHAGESCSSIQLFEGLQGAEQEQALFLRSSD
jgi:beta-1,4-N-acetylglucosaminyltransferase